MSKKKKIIIGVITTIILLCAATAIYLFLTKDNKTDSDNHEPNNNNNNNVTENIEYTYTSDGPGFFCSNTPLGRNPLSYVIGEYVYCTISYELNGSKPGIHEIWAEYSLDEDVEYVETLETASTEWTLEEENTKFHLTTSRPTVYAEYFYQVKFRIKPTTKKEEVTIEFKNIRYKDSENNYYETDNSSHRLSIDETTNYHYKEDDKNKEFTFYKLTKNEGYKQINKYTCKSKECYIYASQCTSYMDLDNGRMLLMDGDSSILYDFNKGIIGTYALGVEYIKDYLIVKDIKTEKYGIIDTAGKVIKDFKSDSFGENVMPCFNEDTISIDDDLIVEKKNNKYGIIKITKDEIVIEHKFDSIRLHSNKYFKAKLDGKWYLYSLDTKEKVLEEGYKELFMVNDNIMIAEIDKALYIKDYQGNNIIEDKIEVLMEYNEGACCGASGGYGIYEEQGIINIYIDIPTEDDGIGYKTEQYTYNIKDKKLTKKAN